MPLQLLEGFPKFGAQNYHQSEHKLLQIVFTSHCQLLEDQESELVKTTRLLSLVSPVAILCSFTTVPSVNHCW